MNTLLTVSEVARLLNLTRRATYRLIRRKQLNAIRIGRLLRILPNDLELFLEERRKGGS